MRAQPIVYEIVSLAADVCLKDTRAHQYRTRTGKIRPILSMCLAPRTNLVMAYSLNAEPLNPQTLAALLYTAFTPSETFPYRGLPDLITCDNLEAFSPALQQTLEGWGIQVQQGSPENLASRRHTERLLARMQQEFWQALSAGTPADDLSPEARTAQWTIFEVDHLLRSYLLTSNQAISGGPEDEDAPHVTGQPLRNGDPSQLGMLLGAPHPRTLTHKGIAYLTQTYWQEQLAALAPGTTVFLRPVPVFSASSPETIEVFFQGRSICSFAVQHEGLPREKGSGREETPG